jgi:hypothetical protein
MEKGFATIKMAENMMDFMFRDKNQEKGHFIGWVETFIKVIGVETNKMDLENLLGVVEILMKVIGKIIYFMAKELTNGKMVACIKVIM